MDISIYNVRTPFPGVYAIGERGANCYLVCGKERALLIDTGWGFGDLAGLVASLTPLPVTVVITHGHPDHINGANQFPVVLISAADLPLTAVASPGGRRAMLERISARGPLPEGFSPEAWINGPPPKFETLPADAVFALGGRTLQVIPTPGHTPGSVCLLDADARLLFTGDTIVAGNILMYLEMSLPLHVYAESLQTLSTRSAEFDALLPGHGDNPLPPALIEELRQGALAIARGEIKGELTQTPLGEAYCAKLANSAICYNPERL